MGRAFPRRVRIRTLQPFHKLFGSVRFEWTRLSGTLRVRSPDGQATEVLVACNLLNKMTDTGRPDSDAIGR